MAKAELINGIVCPACKGELNKGESDRRCEVCGVSFPEIDGIPMMMLDANDIVLQPEVKSPVGGGGGFLRKAFSLMIKSIPTGYHSPITAENFGFLRENTPAGAACLAVGGGIDAFGKDIAHLGKDILADLVNLEVLPGPVVDLVADGHDIPFPDETFDLIISQAVLEHVKRPRRVVAEMLRVLKPGGLIFVDVPFIANVHMYSDFWRYTPRGLDELMQDFEPLRSGQNAGLGAAAALINSELMAAVLSCGNTRYFYRLRRICRRLTSWQRCWDKILEKTSLPPDAPNSIYFIGRRN